MSEAAPRMKKADNTAPCNANNNHTCVTHRIPEPSMSVVVTPRLPKHRPTVGLGRGDAGPGATP